MKIDSKPRLLYNFFYSLSYKLVAILVPLITTPYIARVLRAESIGAFSYAQSIATYFSLFGIVGLNLYGQLKISNNRENYTKLSSLFCEIFFSKCITLIIALISYIIFVFIYNKYTSILLIMSITIVAEVFDISWFFQGLEEFKKLVIRNYIIKIIGLILILLIVKSEKDVLLYAIIISCSTLFGNVSLWYNIQFCVRFDHVVWKNVLMHIKKSLVYFVPTIATTMYTATDTVMLGAIIGSDYENGIYAQAHKIKQVLIILVASMSSVLLPRLSYLYNSNDEKTLNRYIVNAINITGLLEIPIMCGLFGVSDIFIPVFLGSEFEECIAIIKIFSVLILFSGINTVIGDSCLVSQNKQSLYNIGVFAGAIINILFNVILIPMIASRGAAISSLISELTVFIIFLYFVHSNNITLGTIIKKWIKYFIASVLMGFEVWLIGGLLGCGIKTLIIQIVIGFLSYCTLLFVLRDSMMLKILKILRN